MDSGDVIQLIVLLILLLLSAFFSSAETAMTTVNKIYIMSLVNEGNKRAKILQKIIDNPGKLLSTILIGNNIVNLSASSLATTWTTRVLGNAFVGIATGILTLLVLLFGEITPKTMATLYAEKLSMSYAPVIYFLMKVLTPVIFIVNRLSNGILYILGVDPKGKQSTMTEQELRTIVDVSHEDGVIESEEKKMIYNVFDFGDSRAKDVMVPRIDMSFIDVNATYEELLDSFKEDGYTRYPVYEDSTDNIIGTINMKDLLLWNPKEKFSIRDILRKPYFTYEHKSTAALLMEMKQYSVNFVIVLDEYGATAGMITMEDLLEEIVGEIRDEYDADEVEDMQEIVPDREYTAQGSAKLDDLNEALGLKLDSEDYDSIGGYIIEKLDYFPKEGESYITEDGVKLVVDATEKNRIEAVHIYIPEGYYDSGNDRDE
ncbi:HlyC/CorC family transporter [Blautia sp.]|uniref:HlyC/CorC family transporter n=1 Tax=Blautia sp. TaxID=1955243 RepID=UPI00280A7B3A|nr:hemolysin family protein [Blautia sp.]MDY3017253.1 hemolysin family protein [Blautia sp.]MED9881490.1 hemolysin family protein [Blautia sp.]